MKKMKKILLLIGAILAIALFFPKQSGEGSCGYSPKGKKIICSALYCECKGLYLSIKKPLPKDLLIAIRNFTKTCKEAKRLYPFENLEKFEKREFEGYCIGIPTGCVPIVESFRLFCPTS